MVASSLLQAVLALHCLACVGGEIERHASAEGNSHRPKGKYLKPHVSALRLTHLGRLLILLTLSSYTLKNYLSFFFSFHSGVFCRFWLIRKTVLAFFLERVWLKAELVKSG